MSAAVSFPLLRKARHRLCVTNMQIIKVEAPPAESSTSTSRCSSPLSVLGFFRVRATQC